MKITNLYKSISIALLFVVILFSACNEKQKSNDLFKEYYSIEIDLTEKYLIQLTTNGFADEDSGRKDTLVMAIQLYNKGNYQKSTRVLTEYLEHYSDPSEDFEKATFFYGLNQIEHEKYADAINSFGSLLKTEDEELMHKCSYYRALCYLKVDENKAKSIFNEISENNRSPYKDEAKALVGLL